MGDRQQPDKVHTEQTEDLPDLGVTNFDGPMTTALPIVQHGTHVTCAPAPYPNRCNAPMPSSDYDATATNAMRARQLYSSYRDPNILTIVHALPLQLDTFISTTAPAKDVNKDIMDAFVSSVGRYTGGEDELRECHCLAGSVPLGERWLHKYLGDLDGMSYIRGVDGVG